LLILIHLTDSSGFSCLTTDVGSRDILQISTTWIASIVVMLIQGNTWLSRHILHKSI